MPTARQWRQYDRDRIDADILRRAGAWLRDNPDRAGLSHDHAAHALGALLDILADVIADLDPAVRWETLEGCRVLLGQPMAALKRHGRAARVV